MSEGDTRSMILCLAAAMARLMLTKEGVCGVCACVRERLGRLQECSIYLG